MKKNLYPLTIAFALSVLVSCSGNTINSRSISNQSSQIITLSIPNTIDEQAGALILNPGQTESFSVDVLSGRNQDIAPCTEGLDTISLIQPIGLLLNKDFFQEDNWDLIVEKKRIGGDTKQDCLFTITDEDFD